MSDWCEQAELFCLLTVLFVGAATVWFEQRQPEPLESLRVGACSSGGFAGRIEAHVY